MSEQRQQAPEPIRWLIEQFEQLSDAFTSWFENFVVDVFTDDYRHPDEFDRHGFTRPERKPDGIWHLPESEEYPTGEVNISFWLQQNEVLAFSESEDPIMFQDCFSWYRIPVSDIIPRMRNDNDDPSRPLLCEKDQ